MHRVQSDIFPTQKLCIVKMSDKYSLIGPHAMETLLSTVKHNYNLMQYPSDPIARTLGNEPVC